MSIAALVYRGVINRFHNLCVCASSPVVHRELTDGGERAAEEAGGRRRVNQTEQKEAQTHPAAAHVPTAEGKFPI